MKAKSKEPKGKEGKRCLNQRGKSEKEKKKKEWESTVEKRLTQVH